jgi:hypothetical protein
MWQDIATAPKDRNVIVWENDGEVMGEAYYDGEDDSWWWANTSPHDFDACRQVYPNLWHPMPAPPLSNGER